MRLSILHEIYWVVMFSLKTVVFWGFFFKPWRKLAVGSCLQVLVSPPSLRDDQRQQHSMIYQAALIVCLCPNDLTLHHGARYHNYVKTRVKFLKHAYGDTIIATDEREWLLQYLYCLVCTT